MKKILLLLAIIISVQSIKSEVLLTQNSVDQEKVYTRVPFGDPFIMLWVGKYYAYGTNARDRFIAYVSNVLLTWSIPSGLKNGLVLDKADSWADRWFWAPEVYYVTGNSICIILPTNISVLQQVNRH